MTRVTEIGTCEDETERRELLTSLSEDVQGDYDRLDELTEQNQNLSSEVESVREANMKLFLRVSEDKSEAQKKKEETGIDEEKEKRSFANLFDEKGGIK